MDDDVLPKILLHLPVQCLLRFRAVCKFWCHIIDSLPFRKLHNHNNNCNKSEDTVFLHVIISDNGIRVQHNRRSLISNVTAHFNDVERPYLLSNERASFYGPVKGLICINPSRLKKPIAICNPFLGQFKILPSLTSTCLYSRRSAAVGFDEDYKVVQLLECEMDYSLHAHVYSSTTGTWKELAGDSPILDNMRFCGKTSPMKSACKNGYFAHWLVYGHREGKYGVGRANLILSFNMRNEVFQTIDCGTDSATSQYFAEDEHSFLRFDFHSKYENFVQIYESSFEGKGLSWNRVMHVEVPLHEILPRSSTGFTGCVFYEVYEDVFVYDYRARKFICVTAKKNISLSQHIDEGEIFEYRGSFVSLM